MDEYLIFTKHVLMRRCVAEPQQTVTIVPIYFVSRLISYYDEGPGGSYQATKATTAKIGRVFW